MSPPVQPTPDLHPSLGFLFSDIHRLVRREFDRRVQTLRLGLTQAQWLVIAHLNRRPGLRLSELADLLQVERMTASRHVARLASTGWIERQTGATENHTALHFLTPKAIDAAKDFEGIAATFRREYLSGIPLARRNALVEDLLSIRESLLRMGEPSSPPSAPTDRPAP